MKKGFNFSGRLSPPKGFHFGALSSDVSIATEESHEPLQKNKSCLRVFPEKLLHVFPFALASGIKNNRVGKAEAAKSFSECEREDDAPLLNYSNLFRQWADPEDEMLSFPVAEPETSEISNVVY
jgi:hypothetical protein